MKISASATLLAVCLMAISTAHAADHNQMMVAKTKTASPQAGEEASPKLIVSSPDATILKDGYVYLPFHVENMMILPIYTEIAGAEATKLKPTIGHIHVMVDGAGWKWIHASTDPIYFGQLPPGAHKVELELVNAAHSVIEVQTIDVVVPERG
ncbi:hypothetical protein J5277_22530 [Rhizobium sp. 16-449-1b]|uniref:DUF6130 family protein n=1 Tax=Rhizobium sp. 16-449-1b TaxID=2819989 RepID=UPI00068CFAB5|nr:DUF6130 family protein [Rhizobium sp. 16-449-1b]MBO9196892.1 hypothetical protein [Rhizobium sp. 16-449-1b]